MSHELCSTLMFLSLAWIIYTWSIICAPILFAVFADVKFTENVWNERYELSIQSNIYIINTPQVQKEEHSEWTKIQNTNVHECSQIRHKYLLVSLFECFKYICHLWIMQKKCFLYYLFHLFNLVQGVNLRHLTVVLRLNHHQSTVHQINRRKTGMEMALGTLSENMLNLYIKILNQRYYTEKIM